jgi:hypothetical protein
MRCTIPKYWILGVLQVGGVPPYGGADLKPAEDAEYICRGSENHFIEEKNLQRSPKNPFQCHFIKMTIL